jgi:autotransporter-associated beta strand protein
MPKTLFCALLLSLAAIRLPAQTYWITPTNTTATAFPWNGATNWSSGIVPSATDAVVVFTNFPGSQPAVNTTNIISGGTNTPFIFGTLVCSNSQVLNGGGQLNAAVSAGTPTIYVGSGSLWLYPLLGGMQGFNKTGAGEVTFRYNNNNNPFTGNVIISGGDLCLNIDSNLGNTNNDLVISNNAKLLINPTTAAPVTLAPARTVTLACALANFDVAGTNWLTIPGVINESVSGQGGLQKTDSGTLALSGVNIFGGGTTVSGGVLDCQTNAALGKGGATISSGGELACDANVILTNALTLAGGTISFNGSGGAFAGPVTFNNDSTVALRSFLTGAAASGAISNAINDTANTLTVAGAGTLTFASGANSSTINMLRLTNSTAILASGTLNINTGGTPGNTTVTGGSGFNNFGGSTFTVNGGTLALAGNYFIPAGNSGGGNNFFTLQSGNVNNNGGEILLAYAANGTLNINGGTFNNQSQSIRVQQGATGVVNLNGGVLALNQFDNAGGTGGTVNFNGGTLRANVDGSSLLQSHNSYVVKTGGAVIDSQSYAVSVDVPLVSGSSPDGGLKKVGSGTLTLTATNSYNGPTTISAGTLALGANALITGSSNLLVNSSSTLLFALNAPSGPTNIVVNGNVTLAGQINVSDFGIVANSVYPVIYYTGNLTNNGVTVASLTPWAFTIDTSVPHVVRLLVGQKYPLFQLTNSSFAVSTLTTNLGGILHGAPALPLWYEVRDQTNRLWDYGATPAVSPWSITVRHLRAGANTVTVFAKDTTGNITSNTVQLNLALGANTPVRPRPQPAEVWWGGSCHDNIYNNGSIVGTYSRMSQLLQTNGWDFCKRYQDGFFLHGYVWVNQAAQMTNWQQVGQSISSQLAPFNGKYWLEDAWHAGASNMNYGVSSASGQAGNSDMLLGVGFALSEVTQDFNADWVDFCNWHPDWPPNDIRVLITGNTNQASAAYPYASGQWRDYANSYHAARPNTKFGWTWSPVWWHWQNGASLGNDSGIFTVTSNGTNYNFNWDFYNFMNDAVVAGNQSGVPFAFASDCPWEYYMQYPGNPGGWTQAQQLANRVKIRNYEAWLQNQNLRHTMICNSYSMNSSDTNSSDLNYEAHSLAVMYLHQQEGGRAWRYSFESWYEGPYTVVPETKAGSYTHLAMSAIKYIKGIADTNGNLEQLNITPTATNGTVAQLQLQNNGDVQCLPTLAGQIGTVPGVTTRYFTTNGAEITATILTAEGLCYTNMLQPGVKTNFFAVTLANNLSAATNDNAALEAFWNPQDPLGIVRDREFFAAPLSPLGLWQDADIGSVGITGGSALSGTNFTLLGSGADVWGTADAFHFVYQTNNGDGTLTARVTSQIAANVWSKAGVMVRENVSAGARNAFMCVTPNNGVNFQNRAATGGASFTITTGVSGLVAPYWVRLTRSGTTFTALCSSNGVNWVTVGSSNLTGFATAAVWGLAATAHDNTLASAVTFDNVALPNVAPVLNPISNRTLVAGQTLTLTNAATDANLPAQTLMFSLLSAPSGMTLNPTNGILSWRPTIAQSPTTNAITVQVADNGTPSLSATQSFTVTVLSPAAPALTAPVVSAGIFSLLVNGSSGPDYILLAATNLNPPVTWLPLKTNLAATPPFVFTNPATNFSGRFYRVLLGP